MKIIVLGAGSWGTALAISACRSAQGAHEVSLWARDGAQVAAMAAARINARYLPGIAFPSPLQLVHGEVADLPQLTAHSDLIIIATPMAGLRQMLHSVRGVQVPVAWLCKGFEAAIDGAPGMLGHEILHAVAPNIHAGVLSGPSFAQEVARGQPTALVAASVHAEVRQLLVSAFHGATLRVYANEDVVGVEVGGAVKNVLAVATGLCDGLHLGLNARAALITRGLAEMTRLGLALGAKADTFMGLGGLGDLVLTATGDLSRNRRVGLALAEGKTLQQATEALGHVAEGVYSARTVVQRAAALGVEMPISQSIVDLLDGKIRPEQAVARLMARDPAEEKAPGTD